MRAIASGAGISIGGLYLYFENKETIYMTVLKEIFDELTTKVKEAVGQVDDPVQALTSLITLRLAYARKHRELIILQSREQGFAYALTLKRQFFRNQTAIIENILNLCFEQPRQLEGKRQGRIIFACLDGVHRLPRNIEPFAKLCLAPLALCAQHSQPVLHVSSYCPCVSLP